MTRHRKLNSNKSHQKCYFVGKSNGKTLNYDCTLQMTTCQYTKDDGDLCKRRTVNGLGLCYFHLALQQGLRIHLKNQTLHTTATKRYLPDEEIYRFQQIPQFYENTSLMNHRYIVRAPHSNGYYYIDCLCQRETGCFARKNHHGTNAKYVYMKDDNDTDCIVLRSTRTIPENTEIVVYDDDHLEKTKIVTVHKTRETPSFYEDKTVGEYVHLRRRKREIKPKGDEIEDYNVFMRWIFCIIMEKAIDNFNSILESTKKENSYLLDFYWKQFVFCSYYDITQQYTGFNPIINEFLLNRFFSRKENFYETYIRIIKVIFDMRNEEFVSNDLVENFQKQIKTKKKNRSIDTYTKKYNKRSYWKNIQHRWDTDLSTDKTLHKCSRYIICQYIVKLLNNIQYKEQLSSLFPYKRLDLLYNEITRDMDINRPNHLKDVLDRKSNPYLSWYCYLYQNWEYEVDRFVKHIDIDSGRNIDMRVSSNEGFVQLMNAVKNELEYYISLFTCQESRILYDLFKKGTSQENVNECTKRMKRIKDGMVCNVEVYTWIFVDIINQTLNLVSRKNHNYWFVYVFLSDMRIQNTDTSVTKQCIELYKDRHIDYLNKFNILFFQVFHDTMKEISEQSNTVLNSYVPSFFTFDSYEHSRLLHHLFTLFFMFLLKNNTRISEFDADDVSDLNSLTENHDSDMKHVSLRNARILGYVYNNWQDCLEKYTFRENLWKKLNSDRFKLVYAEFVIKLLMSKDELPSNTLETINNQYDTLTRDSCESPFINGVDNYLNPIVYNDIFNTQETSSNNDYNVNSQQVRDSENIQSTNNNNSDEPIYSNSTNDTSHSKRQPNKKKREKKSTKQNITETENSNRKRRKTKQQQNSENEIKSVKDTRTPQNIQRMEGFSEKLNQLIKLNNITDKTIKDMLHKQMLSYANTNKKQNTLSERWFNNTLSNIKIEYINDFEKSNHLKNDDTFKRLNLTRDVINSKRSIDELRTYITVEYCIEYFTKTHGLDRKDPLVINMIDILKEKNYTIPMFKQNEQLIYKEAQKRIETGEAFDDEDFKFIDDEEDDGESEIEVQEGKTTPSFGRKTHERYVYYWFFVHLLLKCIHDYIKYMKTYEDNEKQVHRARVLYTVWSKKMKRIIENLKNKWNVRITEKTKLSPTKTTNFLKLYRTFVTDYNKKLKSKSNSKNSFKLKSSNDKSNLGHWFFALIYKLQ